MWIAGQFDPSKIKCSEVAKKEAERLAEQSQITIDSSFFAKDHTFIVWPLRHSEGGKVDLFSSEISRILPPFVLESFPRRMLIFLIYKSQGSRP